MREGTVARSTSTAWTVAAALWGLCAVYVGAVRVHDEWTSYRFWQDLLSSGGADSAVIGWSYVETPTFDQVVSAVWVATTAAWVGLGVAQSRPRHARAQLAVLAIGLATTVVLWRDARTLPSGIPDEAHLMTWPFVCAVLLTLDGVAAIAIAGRPRGVRARRELASP